MSNFVNFVRKCFVFVQNYAKKSYDNGMNNTNKEKNLTDEIKLNIGTLIRELRKEQNLTQSELAQIMQTTQDTISLWELGKSMPDIIALVKLAKLFNVSTDYLLDLEA